MVSKLLTSIVSPRYLIASTILFGGYYGLTFLRQNNSSLYTSVVWSPIQTCIYPYLLKSVNHDMLQNWFLMAG